MPTNIFDLYCEFEELTSDYADALILGDLRRAGDIALRRLRVMGAVQEAALTFMPLEQQFFGFLGNVVVTGGNE